MVASPPSTRRDARYALRPGSCFVELIDSNGMQRTAALISISAAGFSFEVKGDPSDFPRDVHLENVVVRIGEGVMHGEARIRSSRLIGDRRNEVGCMFYPSYDSEDRWMAILTGVRVAQIS